MSEPRTSDLQSIEIPGEPTLWKTTGIPPVTIGLPLAIRSAGGPRLLVYCLVWSILTVVVLHGLATWTWLHVDITVAAFQALLLLFLAVIVAVFFQHSMVLLWGLLTDPALIITGDEFYDRRTETVVRWDQVDSITLVNVGHRETIIVAILTLRRTATRWRRHWLQPLGVLFSRPDNELQVLISHLDYPAGRVGATMEALVVGHGGKVVSHAEFLSRRPKVEHSTPVATG